FFIRYATPLELWRTTFSLCFIAAGSSRWISLAETPTSAPWRASSRTSAVWRSALVGMQPRNVQTPPSLESFSTRSTDMPSCADRTSGDVRALGQERRAAGGRGSQPGRRDARQADRAAGRGRPQRAFRGGVGSLEADHPRRRRRPDRRERLLAESGRGAHRAEI